MTKHKRSDCGSILRKSIDGWQIAPATTETTDWHAIHSSGRVEPDALARSAAEFVASQRLSENVAIALDSRSTFAAKLTVETPKEIRDRRVMGYRFEEILPVAAEDFTVDYVTEGKNVFGIATPIHDLLPVVSALEKQGLHVQSISPSVIYALQSFLRDTGDPSCDLLIWQDGAALEVFRVGRHVQDWRHLPAESSSLVQHIAAVLLREGGPLRIVLLEVDSDLHKALDDLDDVEVQLVDSLSLSEHAQRGTAAALTGKVMPWFELRRDKLITGDPHRTLRRDWQRCQWAMAILLLTTAFFFWMRGRQFENAVVEIQEQQTGLYKQVFPNTRVPNAVTSRLKSERTKLLGARGSDAAVEQPPSALNVLHDFVMGLSPDLRLQVQQLRVESGKVYLDANVRSVGDAGELADALEQHGFAIEPPTTEQYDSKLVSVRINGRLSTQRSETSP